MFKSSIVVFTNTLLDGGAEKQAVLLAKALQSNYKVYLVIFYGEKINSKLLDLIQKEKVQLLFLSGNKIKKFLFFYLLLRKYKINIIFSYLATTNFYSAIVGKLARVKYRIGGIRSSEIKGIKLLFQRILLNSFLTCSISNSYSGKENMLKNGFNASKLLVVPNCIEIKSIVKATTKVDRKINNIKVISVARFVPVKDHLTALKAIRALIDNIGETFSIKYLLVGFGELEEEIRRTIKDLTLQDHAEIILNPPNIYDYYSSSDIYLSTSLTEGLSNSIMEAMKFSLPIVATDVGDNKELIVSGRNGFLTKVGDIEDISAKLSKLIVDDSLRVQMGLNSYVYLKDNFSIEKFKQRYIELIENLVNEKKN